MSLTPQEKAAIEAERRKRPALRRWYPESPYEETAGLSPEEKKAHVIKWLKDAVEEEEKDAKFYWLVAKWMEEAGEPGYASGLREISLDEEKHRDHIKNILKLLGETV